MISLALSGFLIAEHNPSHWEMSCSEWNQNRVEIMSDPKEYLIDYFRTKVSDDRCDVFIIGRK